MGKIHHLRFDVKVDGGGTFTYHYDFTDKAELLDVAQKFAVVLFGSTAAISEELGLEERPADFLSEVVE